MLVVIGKQRDLTENIKQNTIYRKIKIKFYEEKNQTWLTNYLWILNFNV